MASADCIAAIATAPGRGGIGVVRISGACVQEIARALLTKLPDPRHATLCDFREENNTVIDQGIALYFPAPHSFTGEDVLELQGHGGPAVLQLLLARCVSLGARLAEPGEFTQRAFLNDKLDLAQAESVADLIDAASAEAARSAVRSLQGEFSRAIHQMVDSLINLRMLVEATLDFPEEDLDFLQAADALGKLSLIETELDHVLATAKQGSLLREGLLVVLIGQPNVGKSSLLNRLAGEEVAIVTPHAGTTRDTIRQQILIQGVPLHIIDTAGLRTAQDEVEQIGITRTWAAIEKASLAVVLSDASQVETASDQAILERLPAALARVRVVNKIDLTQQPPQVVKHQNDTEIYLSAKSGAGIDLLRQHLLEAAGWQPSGEGAYMARQRHLEALLIAQTHLLLARQHSAQTELLAEELRSAQNALSSITGEFGADDLLGEIFSRFCIGK